ncbi:MarR family transcriptional regulator [Nocardia sp. NPDC019255]|uniref:MarR family winged helix-turn-helix transcriptional regulator n=1 Tax=Nocardia sp. NPDC019255 TaxID=3154591 RepID=UPI0034041125
MTSRAPLTDVERRAWQCLDSLMIRIPTAVDARLARDAGMTHFQYRVLASLAEQPRCQMQQIDLARLTDASQSRLSHVVSGLERRGWVRRVPSSGRRGANAVLTADGLDALKAATEVFLDAVRGLVFDGLDESEVWQLLTVAETLLEVSDVNA